MVWIVPLFYKKKSAVLTSGCACNTSTSFSEAGAVHNHPALVGLLPGLTNHVGGASCIIITALRYEGKQKWIHSNVVGKTNTFTNVKKTP